MKFLLHLAVCFLIFLSPLIEPAGLEGCPGGAESLEDGSCGSATESSTESTEPTTLSMKPEPVKDVESSDGDSSKAKKCDPGYVPTAYGCRRAATTVSQIVLERTALEQGSTTFLTTRSTSSSLSSQTLESSTMSASGSSVLSTEFSSKHSSSTAPVSSRTSSSTSSSTSHSTLTLEKTTKDLTRKPTEALKSDTHSSQTSSTSSATSSSASSSASPASFSSSTSPTTFSVKPSTTLTTEFAESLSMSSDSSTDQTVRSTDSLVSESHEASTLILDPSTMTKSTSSTTNSRTTTTTPRKTLSSISSPEFSSKSDSSTTLLPTTASTIGSTSELPSTSESSSASTSTSRTTSTSTVTSSISEKSSTISKPTSKQLTESGTTMSLPEESTSTSSSTSSMASSSSTLSPVGTTASTTLGSLLTQPSTSPSISKSTETSVSYDLSSSTSSSSSESPLTSAAMRTTNTMTIELESTQYTTTTGLPVVTISMATETSESQMSSSSTSDMEPSSTTSVSSSRGTLTVSPLSAGSGSSEAVPSFTKSMDVSTQPRLESSKRMAETSGVLSSSTEFLFEPTETKPKSTGAFSESAQYSTMSDLSTIETSSDLSTIAKSSSEAQTASSADSLLVSSDGTPTESESTTKFTENTFDESTKPSSQITEMETEVMTRGPSVNSFTSGQSTMVETIHSTRPFSSMNTLASVSMGEAKSLTERGVTSTASGSSDTSSIATSPVPSTSNGATTVTSETAIGSSTTSIETSSATQGSESTLTYLEASMTSSEARKPSMGKTFTPASEIPVVTTDTSTQGAPPMATSPMATTSEMESELPSRTASQSGSSRMTTETEQRTSELESSTVAASSSTPSSTADRSSEVLPTPTSTVSSSTNDESRSSSSSSKQGDTATGTITSSKTPAKSEAAIKKQTTTSKQRSASTTEPTVGTKTQSLKKQFATTPSSAPASDLAPSSTSTSSSSASQSMSTPPSSMKTTSIVKKPSSATPTTVSKTSTVTDPASSRQCPDGYLIGASSCFLLVPASAKVHSYQSSLSFCKATALQTLASLDKIKGNTDIKLIQEKAALLGVDWIFANGIGGQQERFRKSASVYSIYSQSLTSSPIVKTVGISEVFGNVSALCVLPQYCKKNQCDVQKLFLAYDFYSTFSTKTETLEPQEKGSVTCLYGNKKTTTVTCNTLGTIYPNPTIIDCQEGLTERPLKDTTNETVSSCKVCFGRGTKECQSVLNDNGEVEGYRCMSRCWKTVNPCNPTACGPNGVCHNEIGEMKCTCNWGYSGDKCEKNLKDEFFKKATYSTASGATITLGELILKVLKSCILGLSLAGMQGNDIQDTHQYFRTFCTVAAGVILTMWSNPTVFGINQAACRYYFILIHFFYMLAMIQWILEAVNVNKVLRAVHSNTWEVDNRRNRSWGVRVIVRLALPTVALAVFLLTVFQTGWFKLAASWTCVGHICQENLSVWITVFLFVGILALWAAGVYETSLKIQRGRPLIRYLIDFMIERQLTLVEGQRVNKCRDNAFLSFVGLLLLINQWIAVILSSDYRDSKIFGVFAVLSSGAYSLFCSYQDIWTNPEERGNYLQLMQRFFPRQFAPDYNPETTWTFDEVRAHFALPKAERDEIYESFLSRNQQLQCHHRWDLRLNEILAEDHEITVNLALCKVFCEEMNRLKARRGTNKQKEVIKEVYAAYMHSVPHVNPREAGRLRGRLELVTLAAEDDHYPGGVRMARFFIVPRFHIFEPEIPERGDSAANLRNRNHQRRLLQQLEADIYELAREEALSQRTFMNSAIQFMNYGNKVIR